MTPSSKGTQVKRVPGSRAASTTSSRGGNKRQAAKVAATATKRPALPKKKAPPVVKKTATPTKKVVSPAKKAAPATAKKAAPATAKKAVAATAKKAAPAKGAASASPKSASAAKKAVASAKKVTPATKKAAEKPAAKKAAAASGGGNGAGLVVPVVARTTFTPRPKPPAPVRPKTGPYGKDLKFLDEVRELLVADRAIYQEQATSLRAEADSLALEREPGDVQFDEESGEGGTVTVDRERNLALSGQAVLAVEEIDDAMKRIDDKTYGYCERCFQPIPKPRLRALPYARLCVACKSGGLSRR
jgi:DnaK suppressor protein